MEGKRVTIPAAVGGLLPVVSLSGGKDSTATALGLLEAGVEAEYVFADTGWEAPPTYEHLELLERYLGKPIVRVGYPGGFAARALREGILPSGKTAWCTRELKTVVVKAHHERLAVEHQTDTVNVVGIRADESEARSKLTKEFEFDLLWDGYVWRPLLFWGVAAVLAIHHRHGVPVNPLYKLGFSRVGCAPCRNANKTDIRLWAEHFPERIALVAELEALVTAERARRGHAGPATFFRAKTGPLPIADAVAWSKTAHGGKHLPVVRPPESTGCFRWGLCEPPTPEDGEEGGDRGVAPGG